MIVSDDAGLFAVGRHALCWVHAERSVHKLDTFTDLHRAAQEHMRALIWWFYADLKAYRLDPSPRRRGEMRARFDRIFARRTGFAVLDRLLARLHANKPELPMVRDRPDIPLHTNGSERDIRCQVIKRKISGGTKSDAGRDCRDAFLALMHTCAKLGIAFWDYLGDRLGVDGQLPVPELADLSRCRGQPASPRMPGVSPRLHRSVYGDLGPQAGTGLVCNPIAMSLPVQIDNPHGHFGCHFAPMNGGHSADGKRCADRSRFGARRGPARRRARAAQG